MPTPHRGTPEELQELRSRIEALELRQRIHSVILSTAEKAQQGVVTRAEFEAAIARVAAEARQAAMNELRAASAEARPGGLVERVAEAIAHEGCKAYVAVYGRPARAAIRAVAGWLRTGRLVHAAELLEQEADRG